MMVFRTFRGENTDCCTSDFGHWCAMTLLSFVHNYSSETAPFYSCGFFFISVRFIVHIFEYALFMRKEVMLYGLRLYKSSRGEGHDNRFPRTCIGLHQFCEE